MLMDRETQKLQELEEAYQSEGKEWKNNLRRRKQVPFFPLHLYNLHSQQQDILYKIFNICTFGF